jgi:hypothetical protein
MVVVVQDLDRLVSAMPFILLGVSPTLRLQLRVCLVHDPQIWITLEVLAPLSHTLVYLCLDMLVCILDGFLISFTPRSSSCIFFPTHPVRS